MHAPFQPVITREPEVTLALAQQHGLTEEEYQIIIKTLGRNPNFTELGIYSVMWSEHCSYKNSIALLKTLPRSGRRLLVGAGEENAGLVDIGDGLAVAFKIESHNHPSAVEPYQGAATGVGGILRDIFSMGARPIAALNSLRFGTLDDPKVRHLFKNVVKGVGDYGNSFGVPTIAGEVYFDPCYAGNPLVNAMAVGIVDHNGVAKAAAPGPGNTVMIVGAATGRDGIHGATFASEVISDQSESKRPSVQVGDPFTEKLLMEATLEAIKTGYVVGVQDMGAAGISCSTMEMSAKSGTGMIIDLNKVPLREKGMTAYEIMLSESQERMLFIVQRGKEDAIRLIFDKWDLHSEIIGEVTERPLVQIMIGSQTMALVPPESLVLGGGAPVYYRESKIPEYMKSLVPIAPDMFEEPADYLSVFLKLLTRPNIASKKFVFEQYDSMVKTDSLQIGTGDAGVIRIKGTAKGLAFSTDCNSKYVYLDPYVGAAAAVAEAARNVACTGAEPIAITNCLNFGNPYDPEVYYQFKESIRGIADACIALDTPVTGGNVSFYNESPDSAVFPTPVIGMLGVLQNVEQACNIAFKNQGDIIVLLGKTLSEVGGTEYAAIHCGVHLGTASSIDLEHEKNLIRCVVNGIRSGIVNSAHDLSEGGLAVALFESSFASGGLFGFQLNETWNGGLRKDIALFAESNGRIILTCNVDCVDKIQLLAHEHNVPFSEIGVVIQGMNARIPGVGEFELGNLRMAYQSEIEGLMKS